MGTLASELGPHAVRVTGQSRVYVDANVPAGVVTFMRAGLAWDVLFVIEHDDLRRARDVVHFRLAGQLCRTLISLDRDYLDDEKFPPGETAGVLVLSAPSERALVELLKRLDRELFRRADPTLLLPLTGRKLHAHVDWTSGAREGRKSPRDRSPVVRHRESCA